jgi:hypothetical protein
MNRKVPPISTVRLSARGGFAALLVLSLAPLTLLLPGVAAETASSVLISRSPLTEAGNDAFGTIQEAIRALEADPNTDWTKVNLEALRAHLVDMNNMTLNVTPLTQKAIADGIEISVLPNSARAAASLERVFAAHPAQLEAETGWKMSVSKNRRNYVVVVTTTKPNEVAKIRGLGYIGILAAGSHHQVHHWAIAQGLNPHHH